MKKKKNREKKPVCTSVRDFERTFIPESFRSTRTRTPDLHALAATMVDEALEKTRRELAK